MTKEQEAARERARRTVAVLAYEQVTLKPRDPGIQYKVVRQGDSHYYGVERTDGKTDTRYAGTWDAEQIASMFERVSSR